MTPIGIIADVHAHNWSAFSTTNAAGANSRLQEIEDAFYHACISMRNQGVQELFIAGDLFHVRGKIAPEVMNKVAWMIDSVAEVFDKIHIIPGNHDLTTDHSNGLHNAMSSLASDKVSVYSIPSGGLSRDSKCWVTQVPWIKDIHKLKELIVQESKSISEADFEKKVLILHAPIDGVISGLPDHGLTPKWLGAQGFDYVFAGHYHNHKDFGNGVYSIGALTHHSFVDIGTTAGFVILDDEGVSQIPTLAPKFIDYSEELHHADIFNNYVRVQQNFETTAEREALRGRIKFAGAKGVIINSVKANKTTERIQITNGKQSTRQSLAAYCDLVVQDDDVKQLVDQYYTDATCT